MRAFALALLLACTAAAAPNRGSHIAPRGGLSQHIPNLGDDGVALAFAPASGAGLPSVGELCSTYASELTGNFVCLNGDGTTYSGSRAMTSSGSPTTVSTTVCPNGPDCASVTSQRFSGTVQAWNTASVLTPTGDFSACAVFQPDLAGNNAWIFHQDTGTRGWELQYTTDNSGQFVVWKAGGSSTGLATSANTLNAGDLAILCGTYDFVADGSSVLRVYVNGVEGATSPTSTAVGPVTAGSSLIAVGSGAFTDFQGRVYGAMFTEKILSAATIAAMARTVLADTPTGTLGEALTFTRSSRKFCGNDASSGGSMIPTNRPCIRGGGIENEGASTNLAIRSAEFDHAAWTATNVTVTANTTAAPDGTTTADTLQSTSAGGFVESTAAAIVGTNGAASLWVRTVSGTQAMAIRLRDTTAGADRCTGTLTATTTYQVVACVSSGVTTTNSHSLRIYPGGTGGTGTIVGWVGQQEALDKVTSPIVTAGTSVTRAGETALFVRPTKVTDTQGCVGATFKAVYITGSASARIVDFSAGNPLTLFTSIQLAGDDAAVNAFAAASDMTNRSTRGTYEWSGALQQMTADGTAGATAVYDGTVVSTNLSIGSEESNGSAALFGWVKDIRIGTKPGACR